MENKRAIEKFINNPMLKEVAIEASMHILIFAQLTGASEEDLMNHFNILVKANIEKNRAASQAAFKEFKSDIEDLQKYFKGLFE